MFEPCPGCCSGGYGVIDMALLSVIQRWHGRRTGLPRNTIRKYLRSDGVEFKVPDRPSKLDPLRTDRLPG